MRFDNLKSRMKLSIKNLNSKTLFNKECISFIFTLYSRKLSFYIAIGVYALLLIVYICTPPINGWNSTYFFSNPVTVFIFIFSIFIITSYLSIEIFRGPIDDGSELLIVSKPLNRISLFFSKLISLTYFGVLMMIISFPIVSLSLLFSINDRESSLMTISSIPIGTLLTFFISSSISVLISLFFKKVIALILVICSNIFLLVFSIVCGFALDLTSKLDDQSSNSFSTANILNIDDKNNNVTLNIKKGTYNDGSKPFYKPSDKYNTHYYNSLTFPKVSAINFYAQISNMFSFNKPFKSVESSITKRGLFNFPYYVWYKDGDVTKINNDSENNTFVKLKLPNDVVEKFYLDVNYSSKINRSDYSKSMYKFSKKYSDKNLIDLYNQKLSMDSKEKIDKYISSSINAAINSNYKFDDTNFNKDEKENITGIDSNNIYWKYLNFFKEINYITEMTLSYIFNSENYLNDKLSVFNDISSYIFDWFKNDFIGKDVDLTSIDKIIAKNSLDASNKQIIKELVLLRILGVDFHNFLYYLGLHEKDKLNSLVTTNESSSTTGSSSKIWDYLKLTNENYETNYQFMWSIQNQNYLPIIILSSNKEFLEIDESETNSKTNNKNISIVSSDENNENEEKNNIKFFKYIVNGENKYEEQYTYIPLLNLGNFEIYKQSFQNYKITSFYDTTGLFLGWTILFIVLYSFSYIIYRKKDFK